MPFQRISIDQARSMMDGAQVNVIDVRDPGSFEAGSIAGAVHVSDANLAEYVTATDKNLPLIIYCYHGNMSQGAAEYFSEQGFAEVYSMDGGYEEWRSGG